MSALVRKRDPRRGFRCLRLVVLANVLLVNLPAISVPVVHAETTWTGDVEVSTVRSTNDMDYGPSKTLTINEGESLSYYLRLTEQPTDKDGNPIEAVSNLGNRWWVAIHVDGHRRSGGTYKNVSWSPTIGREIHENNWNQPNSVSITANEDPDTNDEVFTFTHHVWDHDGDCPVHLPGTVTVRVVDNDSVANLPTLRIDDVTVDEGAGEAEFEVTLSARREHDVTVAYATSNGSARAGQDYTMKSGTLTIPQGTTSGTIRVPVIDDGAPESNETFYVNLSSPDGARIEDGRGTGTIEDNEPALSIGDVTVNEGDGSAEFVVTMSETSERAVTVAYATSNGTARAGQDYESTSGTLTITSPDTTGTIEVTVLDDGVPEPDETFQVRLSSADGARIEGARGTGTIEDNEPALSIGDVTVNEGRGPAVFTVTIDEASDRPVTVNYATSNGTARAGQDYESTSGTLTITSPDTTGTIEVTVLDDGVPESDETFQVRLSSADGARIEDARATGTIEDNEPALSIGDVTVNEGDGSAEFVVTMSETSERAVTVNYATSNGTARAGQDYESTSGTLTITSPDTTGTIEVTVLDDGVPEPDETFQVRLSSADGARIEDGKATGTIEDNEPALSVHDKTVNEGAGVAKFEVTMSELSDRDVTVSYATSNGTARAGRDYTSTSGRLTIQQGGRNGTISVPVLDDGVLLEPDETFYVNLSSPDGARIEDGRATGTIEDNDLSGRGVKFAAASYRVTEGAEVAVSVELTESPGTGNSVTIPLTHRPAGGAVEADYSGIPGSVTFGESETRKTFRVTAASDEDDDGGERVVLEFGEELPLDWALADPEISTITIVDVPPSTADGSSTVDDAEREAMGRASKEWVRKFGNTAASHVMDALDARIRCIPSRRAGPAGSERSRPRRICGPLHEEPSSLVIAGRRLHGSTTRTGGSEQSVPVDWSDDSWTQDGWAQDGHLAGGTGYERRSLTVGESLAGSAFRFSPTAEDSEQRVSVWGRGAFSRFDGEYDGVALDGDVTSATLGADYAGERVLVGFAMSHSQGDGAFTVGALDGEAASTMTGFYPYVHFEVDEHVSVWGAVGFGSGALKLGMTGSESDRVGSRLRMGAAGVRRELVYPAETWGVSMAVKADALLTRVSSDESVRLAATRVRAARQRIAVEGGQEFKFRLGEWIAPFIEVGLRHDRGDGESEVGMEIDSGFRYEFPLLGVSAEMETQALLPDVDAPDEYGLSGAFRYDPDTNSGVGPHAELSMIRGPEKWGDPTALWRDTLGDRRSDDGDVFDNRIETEFGFGFPVLGGSGTGTPWVGTSMSERWRELRLGYRVGFGSTVEMGVDGTHRVSAAGDEPSDNAIMLWLSVR